MIKKSENYVLETIEKTREYLDYVEKHYLNVQKAWKVVQEKCTDLRFIYDDFVWWRLDHQIQEHDLSKLSLEEFVQYRKQFFSTSFEEKSHNEKAFNLAWENHKKKNSHHWQTWIKKRKVETPYEQERDCVHMVVDWIAMGYEFENTARDYYEKNKEKMDLPQWADHFIMDILDRVYSDKTKVKRVRSSQKG